MPEMDWRWGLVSKEAKGDIFGMSTEKSIPMFSVIFVHDDNVVLCIFQQFVLIVIKLCFKCRVKSPIVFSLYKFSHCAQVRSTLKNEMVLTVRQETVLTISLNTIFPCSKR